MNMSDLCNPHGIIMDKKKERQEFKTYNRLNQTIMESYVIDFLKNFKI